MSEVDLTWDWDNRQHPLEKFDVNDFKTTEASDASKTMTYRKGWGSVLAQPISRKVRVLSEFDQEVSREDARGGGKFFSEESENVIRAALKHVTLLMTHGELRLAMKLLRNLLMKHPNHPGALYQMGGCFLKQGSHVQALRCFRAFAEIRPTPQAICLVAEVLYLLGRDDEALQNYYHVLNEVIEDPTLLFQVYKNIGNIHVRAGDYDAAEDFYNRAYNINPNSDVLFVNYGTLEIQRENLEEAICRYRHALKINPHNDRAWVGVALIHRQKSDVELARANLEKALDINPTNRTALELFVSWSEQEGGLHPCIERLQNYLALKGDDGDMSFLLAKIFLELGRWQESQIEVERTLALNPSADDARQMKKYICEKLGASEFNQGRQGLTA